MHAHSPHGRKKALVTFLPEFKFNCRRRPGIARRCAVVSTGVADIIFGSGPHGRYLGGSARRGLVVRWAHDLAHRLWYEGLSVSYDFSFCVEIGDNVFV